MKQGKYKQETNKNKWIDKNTNKSSSKAEQITEKKTLGIKNKKKVSKRKSSVVTRCKNKNIYGFKIQLVPEIATIIQHVKITNI